MQYVGGHTLVSVLFVAVLITPFLLKTLSLLVIIRPSEDNFSITPEVCNERDVSSGVHSRCTSPMLSVHKVENLSYARWPVVLFMLIEQT